MKAKTVVIVWLVATVVSLSGVYLFLNKPVSTAVSHGIMGIGIGLSFVWMVGLLSLIVKKVFTRKAG